MAYSMGSSDTLHLVPADRHFVLFTVFPPRLSCVRCHVCCVPLCRKITNYDLVWCNELELDQHIVAMASAGGPIGACVCACVCAHMCVCVCMHACVRVCD